VLFDECLQARFGREFPGHEVQTLNRNDSVEKECTAWRS
jgi:hypothetical protein